MSPTSRSVLVTGANGFIGNAVCRAFVRSGWIVYGLVRRKDSVASLAKEEIIPILGSPDDLSFLPALIRQQRTFDVVVSNTEQFENYQAHFEQIISMLRSIAISSNNAGVRPLILFTSGCKDYGMTERGDSPDLAAHTERSPLNPPSIIAPRTYNAIKVFDHTDVFDAAVLRPTTVFGRSGSYYGPFFEMAQKSKNTGQPLRFNAHQKSVLHGTHVDDCAEAYVKIAEHERGRVAGQCYNISSHRYETLEEIAVALAEEYDLAESIIYDPPEASESIGFDVVGILTGFSQWVGSDKLREEVGWRDKRILFSEGLKVYRLAYEEATRQSDSNVLRIQGYVAAAEASKTRRSG